MRINGKKMFFQMLALFLSFALCVSCLPLSRARAEGKKLNVVTTIFPVYDWVREVVGETDSAEITMLLNSGVDLHSYQPTAADIMKIATCDVFIYVGGDSDEWVEDALAESVNPSMIVINLMDELGEGVKAEEIVEGMEHEHDHDHEHEEGAEDEEHDHEHEESAEGEEHDHEHDEDAGGEEHDHEHEESAEGEEHAHSHEEEDDEHIWLSLRNAQALTGSIAAKLGEANPDQAEAYKANVASYQEKLAALDALYTEAVEQAAFRTVLFGDRFPFRYLTDDYGLTYYAAFSGCSAESEASFETIVFLAQKVDELGLPAVLTIEGDNHRIAETIIQATAAKNQKQVTMDSMQSVTAEDVAAGASYLAIMEANLAALKEALN